MMYSNCNYLLVLSHLWAQGSSGPAMGITTMSIHVVEVKMETNHKRRDTLA